MVVSAPQVDDAVEAALEFVAVICNIGSKVSGLFSVKLIFKKNGKFSSQHVHDNPGLRKMGIHCVVDQDREAREANKAY